MDAALDFDKKNGKKTEVAKFIRKFENWMCGTSKSTCEVIVQKHDHADTVPVFFSENWSFNTQ